MVYAPLSRWVVKVAVFVSTPRLAVMNVLVGRGFGDDDDDENSFALTPGGCWIVWRRRANSGRLCRLPRARFRSNHLALFVRVDYC